MRDDSAVSTDWEDPRAAPFNFFPVEEPDRVTTGSDCATNVPGKQMSDQDRRDGTRSDWGRNQCRTKRNQCRTTDLGDGTGARRHAANGGQGLDTHSGTVDLDSGAEDAVDGQVCVTQRGDPHAGDAAGQRAQLPEGAATAKGIKSEEVGDMKVGAKGGGDLDAEVAEGQQTQLPEDTATVQEIKIGDAGGEQVGVSDGGGLDAEDAEGQQVGVTDGDDLDAEDVEGQQSQLSEGAATAKEIEIEEAGAEQVEATDGSDLDAKDAGGQVAKLPEVTAMTKEGRIEDAEDEQSVSGWDGSTTQGLVIVG
ncbi:hypothetical protein PF005_g23946 [Phytophthora fragariae]|uniref:Uncharacterized protein n=1 Tax=Phytophthora fragariae TaxID=53985 RepID=A0A6A3WFG5_9STRA|nr:hypothetical protein PF009_g24795 [Phytophthora fragariae]KAE9178750.1 hypothetical protein PF005_g23946 [Phytophthora fragariae]